MERERKGGGRERLRHCLTQTPNLEILRLDVRRNKVPTIIVTCLREVYEWESERGRRAEFRDQRREEKAEGEERSKGRARRLQQRKGPNLGCGQLGSTLMGPLQK